MKLLNALEAVARFRIPEKGSSSRTATSAELEGYLGHPEADPYNGSQSKNPNQVSSIETAELGETLSKRVGRVMMLTQPDGSQVPARILEDDMLEPLRQALNIFVTRLQNVKDKD